MLYTISNIYAPDKEKEQVDFFHELKSAFAIQNIDVSDKVILGGDWNVIQNVQLDKLGGNDELKIRSLDMINNLKMQYDLQDIWRILYPTNKRFTWRQKRPIIQCRLDFWLPSVNIQDTVVNADEMSTKSLYLARLRRYKQICVLPFLAKICKFKMAAVFGEGKIFSKLPRVHFLDTLWVENFDKIALSRTVKEIEANLCFSIFGKVAK